MRARSRSAWFRDFLKEELAPYPGRAGTVGRMVVAATLVMIICMTFRLPYGYLGALFALIISRQNPRATLESAETMLLVSGIGAAYVLISAWFVIGVPLLHLVWVIVSFFAVFYAVSAVTNYGAVITFAFMIYIGVPLWDRHLSAETNLEDTLLVLLASSIGVVVTAAVELAFSRIKPGDDIVLPIAERLAAVQGLLAQYLEGRPTDAAEKTITRLEMLGTSRLRHVLRRSDYSPLYRAQMSSVGLLVGRLVDVAAALTQPSFRPSGSDQKQLQDLAATVASIRTDLLNRRIPGSIQFNPDNEISRGVPLLREMEKIVALIPQAFAGSRSMDEYRPALDDLPRSGLVAPDALTNPEHLKFALKGCLAASVCYLIYNSLAWPGISTAVITCMVTALSTIGASRQKQTLTVTGAAAGGFLFGMGSQIFILPHLDSIAGFTVIFVLVTVLAAWVMTSSPRLSYFGVQFALAYYFINLQEFAAQTSLSIARDRVVGILLGLFMMWLVFDQLWGVPAAVEMRRAFISNLRLLAQLVREPIAGDKTLFQRISSLRTTISTTFDHVRNLGDAVLFEFGPSRDQNLALRSRIKDWQSQLRSLYLIRNALLKLGLQLPGFEFPEPARMAQQEFDNRLAKMLERMADRREGKESEGKDDFKDAFERLEQTVRACCSKGPQALLPTELQSFLALSRSIASVTVSLDKDI
jgi:multidrug resistance protein MdtO